MFAKIFESIYDGSLRKDWRALVTFQQLLILGDAEGYVDMTAEAIVSRTAIPAEIINHGIDYLSKADPESRSKDEDGRRIVPIDPLRNWGWRIVNYGAYRDIKNKDDLREYWRGQKREKREEHRRDELMKLFQRELSKLFNRKPTSAWSYAEDCQLLEIIAREDCEEELAEIAKLQLKNARYFPQSLDRLLTNWNSVLDRARINGATGPEVPPHIQLKAVEARLAEHPARPDSSYSREKLTQQQKDEFKALRQKRQALLTTISAV